MIKMTISVEDAVIARITKNGEKFEVLVNPEVASNVKKGKDVSADDLLAAPEVYEDSKKGERAADDKVNTAFGTSDVFKIAIEIIKKGDIQLTTEQRHEMIERKRHAIAAIIAKQGINPQTNQPNPVDRVMRAMEQSKVKIELEKTAEEQIESTIKTIQKILPIKFEKIRISITVGPKFGGKISHAIRSFGSIIKEEWKGDGSYLCVIETSAGMQQEVFDKINSITHGENEININEV